MSSLVKRGSQRCISGVATRKEKTDVKEFEARDFHSTFPSNVVNSDAFSPSLQTIISSLPHIITSGKLVVDSQQTSFSHQRANDGVSYHGVMRIALICLKVGQHQFKAKVVALASVGKVLAGANADNHGQLCKSHNRIVQGIDLRLGDARLQLQKNNVFDCCKKNAEWTKKGDNTKEKKKKQKKPKKKEKLFVGETENTLQGAQLSSRYVKRALILTATSNQTKHKKTNKRKRLSTM